MFLFFRNYFLLFLPIINDVLELSSRTIERGGRGNTCEDKRTDCGGLGDYCVGQYENWMKENCPKTCGLCVGGTCEDKRADCGGLGDFCVGQNENWMKENCPKT